MEKKFNPSIGGAFTTSAFSKNGKDGIKLDINEDNFRAIMENLQVGSSIILRFNKVTTKGNDHYFTEILPPMNKSGGTPAPSKDDGGLG